MDELETCQQCAKHIKPVAEPTGARMREEFQKEFGIDILGAKIDVSDISDWWLNRLSRLHSRIVEGIDFLPFRSEHFYDDKTADKIKVIVNQAFKDL